MKIFIMTDLEGASGINSVEMIDRNNLYYEYSVKRLIADTNAAIDGAFKAGATKVTVVDGHGAGIESYLSLLDSRAELCSMGIGKVWGNLDETYNGIFCVGAHAMAGTMNAFLDHTQSSQSWFNYWVNGRRMGELAQLAMLGAHFNIPVLMVSGDEAACAEAHSFFNLVECAVVKRGMGRNRAELTDIDEALFRIHEAARKSISLAGIAKPFKPILPMEIKLEFYRSDYCDEIADRPGIERLDARTVRKVVDSYLDCVYDLY